MFVLPIKSDKIEDSGGVEYTCVGLFGWDKEKKNILLECTLDDSTIEYVDFSKIKKINNKLVTFDKSLSLFSSPTLIRSQYTLPQKDYTLALKSGDIIVDKLRLNQNLKIVVIDESGDETGISSIREIRDETGANVYNSIDGYKKAFGDYL